MNAKEVGSAKDFFQTKIFPATFLRHNYAVSCVRCRDLHTAEKNYITENVDEEKRTYAHTLAKTLP